MTLKDFYKEVNKAMYGMEDFILYEKETDTGRLIKIIVKKQQGSKVRATGAAQELNKRYADEGLLFRSLIILSDQVIATTS